MAIVTFNGGGGGHTANKGSCADLEAYKEHEKLLRAQEGRAQQTNAKCDIFGADGIMSAEESTRFIDAHRKGLKKDEAKFYEFEINLSEGEQLAMFRDCSTEAQKEKVFQDYIRNVVMEEYARNFKGYTDKFGAAVEFHKENICYIRSVTVWRPSSGRGSIRIWIVPTGTPMSRSLIARWIRHAAYPRRKTKGQVTKDPAKVSSTGIASGSALNGL